MAEKHSGNTFESVMMDLQAGKYAPVYLLAGEEPYFIDKIADFIAENAIKPEERDFNQLTFYGLDTTPVNVMDSAHAAPMMADHQVIIVREAQQMRGIDQLEKYVRKPIASTILVICYKDKLGKSRKGWVSECEKNGVLFECAKVRENMLGGFVTNYLSQHGATIEPKALAMVCDSIGADLSRMASELDKLLLSLPEENKRIVPDFVEEQIGISKDFNVFELRDAIVKKDVMKANRIAKYFDKNPKAGNLHSVVPQLFAFFQNLMIAFYCPNKQRDEDLAVWLGMNSAWRVREYQVAMKNFTAVKTMYIIQKLRSVAAKSNGLDNRNATEGELMQELVYFILH